jgi:hypothetical protein
MAGRVQVKIEHKALCERLNVTVDECQEAKSGKDYQQPLERLEESRRF